MSMVFDANCDEVYRWYEETEDPLWLDVVNQHLLSWWLRESVHDKQPNWFVEGYPTLAPYYPFANLDVAHMDPTLQYYGYWWP